MSELEGEKGYARGSCTKTIVRAQLTEARRLFKGGEAKIMDVDLRAKEEL